MKNKIEQVRKIVEKVHERRDYDYHIASVVKNALLLANKLNADKEIVEVAALLHDIGRAEGIAGEFKSENEHHIIGEKEAENIMKKIGFEKDFIAKVKHCVLTHRGRKGPIPETKEAEIIASADAMAHFDTFLDLFDHFLETSESFEQGVNNIGEKMQRNWDKKLIPEAKEIVKDKYEAIILLIKSMKEHIK